MEMAYNTGSSSGSQKALNSGNGSNQPISNVLTADNLVTGSWITTSPGIGGYSPGIGGYASTISDFASSVKYHNNVSYEMKRIDGTKSIESISFDKVTLIEERTLVERHFSWKFPFIGKSTRKYTRLEYIPSWNATERIRIDVDCNLRAIMKIFGEKYVPFASSVMKISVDEGEDVH